MSEEKLQKVLQTAGIDSRRNIRQQIHDERVTVNNRVITDPNFPVDITRDTIRLDNRKIKLKKEKKSYFILHKPYGVISTLQDPQGRPTIKDFITAIKERVYPVGRLDYHSEGLLLLTNDGELTNFIISPKNKIEKVYMVKIKGSLTEEERRQLKTKGVFLEDHRVKPLQIDFIKKTTQGNSWIRVTIIEGKKHIIRDLLKFSGHPVEKLKRTAIGTIQLKKLPTGHWKELTPEEVEFFKKSCHYTEPGLKDDGKTQKPGKTGEPGKPGKTRAAEPPPKMPRLPKSPMHKTKQETRQTAKLPPKTRQMSGAQKTKGTPKRAGKKST